MGEREREKGKHKLPTLLKANLWLLYYIHVYLLPSTNLHSGICMQSKESGRKTEGLHIDVHVHV